MGWFTSLVLKLFWYLPCAHFFFFSTPFQLNLSKGFRLLSNGKLPILKIFGSLRKVKLQHIIFFGIFPNPKFGFGMLPNLQPSKGHFLGNLFWRNKLISHIGKYISSCTPICFFRYSGRWLYWYRAVLFKWELCFCISHTVGWISKCFLNQIYSYSWWWFYY